MAADLPPIPPEAVPQVAIVAPAKLAAEPIVVESHGYHYVVTGNALLAPEVIVSTVAAAETPKDAIESLSQAYRKAGYLLTALGGQVDGQQVAIRVIHGRITEEDLAPSLAPFYSGIAGREDLDRNTLIRQSAMAENYAARQGMRPKVNFTPGQEFGGTKITVTEEPIEDAKPVNAGLGFNNLGSRFSSRFVAQGNAAARSGAGTELTATYTLGLPGLAQESTGSQYHAGAVGASVVTPWGLYGVSFSNTRYLIGEAAKDQSGKPTHPDGTITLWGANGTQLAFADETARWTFTESFTHTDNFATVSDGGFVTQDQSYGILALGTSFSKSFAVLGENASFSAGLTFSKGLSPRTGSFQTYEGPQFATPHFMLFQGNLSYAQALPLGYTAGVTWTGQWANATVPQNQQWVLGGFGNLTAYIPAVLNIQGDSGMLTRVSLYTPAWQWSGVSVTGSAFFEAGFARRHYVPPGGQVIRGGLSDAGLSLSGSVKPGTSLTLAYAWPLWTRYLEQKAVDELNHANLYFSLNQAF